MRSVFILAPQIVAGALLGRNVQEEFDSKEYGLPDRRPTILGVREHVFTGRCRHLLILHNF
jgi:hypothetical protein